MIEDQEVQFDGKTYVWSYDSTKEHWYWTDERYMSVPQSYVASLNRHFIENVAGDLIVDLDGHSLPRLCEILVEMGATDEEVSAFGLEEYLFELYPGKAPSKFVQDMPPAAHLPFNSVPIRNWFFQPKTSPGQLPVSVSCIGCGPFESPDFTRFLQDCNIRVLPMDVHSSVVVLGRTEWTEDELDDAIDLRVGQTLKIYSQEMFLAFLAKGVDPFYASTEVLDAFKAGHEGLEFVATGWSGWVTTFVPYGNRSSGSQRFDSTHWIEESPLRVTGYRVGKTGVEVGERRRILQQAFQQDLPIVGPANYMAEWGEPSSATRLHKMAESIATHCRNQRAKRNASQQAIEDWESDLKWLRDEFYHGHFSFHWPFICVPIPEG